MARTRWRTVGKWGFWAMVVATSPAVAEDFYCNGGLIQETSGWKRLFYPNGQLVQEAWGNYRLFYPNGAEVRETSGWHRLLYPNGQVVKEASGWNSTYYPNGQVVKDMQGSGRIYYPNGRVAKESGGQCFSQTGTQFVACPDTLTVGASIPGFGRLQLLVALDSGEILSMSAAVREGTVTTYFDVRWDFDQSNIYIENLFAECE